MTLRTYHYLLKLNKTNRLVFIQVFCEMKNYKTKKQKGVSLSTYINRLVLFLKQHSYLKIEESINRLFYFFKLFKY
jgi:hypothetical protein